VEAVFRPDIFRVFFNVFRPKYWFHVTAISGAFLQDTVSFPRVSFEILQDLVAGIIELVTVTVSQLHAARTQNGHHA
jgi:hypothetical protein